MLYDGFYTNDAIFAKGRGVNFGLSLLDKTDWLLHMDSDVCLPEDFTPVLEKKLNDKNSLYWGKRYFSNNKEMRFITEDGWEHKWIGFFQLWHSTVLVTISTTGFGDTYGIPSPNPRKMNKAPMRTTSTGINF